MVDVRQSVIVVEDNPDLREVLKEMLDLQGFRVTTAEGGLPGLLRIGSERPACLILDIKLEDVSGFEVYRVLRKHPDFRDLPVLFISGAYPDEEWVRRQLDAGTVHFLPKPLIENDLLRAVRELIR